MPQFDPAVWVPQLVWLAITFVVLYLLMAKVALPRVGEVLEEREQRINESLRKAEGLKQNAEDAVAAYEKTIADVRAKAAEEVRTAREQAAAEAAKRNAELSERLAGRDQRRRGAHPPGARGGDRRPARRGDHRLRRRGRTADRPAASSRGADLGGRRRRSREQR